MPRMSQLITAGLGGGQGCAAGGGAGVAGRGAGTEPRGSWHERGPGARAQLQHGALGSARSQAPAAPWSCAASRLSRSLCRSQGPFPKAWGGARGLLGAPVLAALLLPGSIKDSLSPAWPRAAPGKAEVPATHRAPKSGEETHPVSSRPAFPMGEAPGELQDLSMAPAPNWSLGHDARHQTQAVARSGAPPHPHLHAAPTRAPRGPGPPFVCLFRGRCQEFNERAFVPVTSPRGCTPHQRLPGQRLT